MSRPTSVLSIVAIAALATAFVVLTAKRGPVDEPGMFGCRDQLPDPGCPSLSHVLTVIGDVAVCRCESDGVKDDHETDVR